MRCFLHLLPLVSLALPGVAGPTSAAERPNVLFIAVDDLRPEIGQMLYDHETDPGENVNVVDDPAHAGTVAELRQRLEEGMGRPGEL